MESLGLDMAWRPGENFVKISCFTTDSDCWISCQVTEQQYEIHLDFTYFTFSPKQGDKEKVTECGHNFTDWVEGVSQPLLTLTLVSYRTSLGNSVREDFRSFHIGNTKCYSTNQVIDWGTSVTRMIVLTSRLWRSAAFDNGPFVNKDDISFE